MRKAMFLVSAGALMLTACGPKTLALPTDPVDKAATCAVVSAADARSQKNQAPGELGFDAQTRIIHYAMLAGTEGGSFSAKNTQAVVERMSALEAEVTGGKWQELKAPCDQAYPQARKTSGITLPEGRFDAQLGCYSLADFLLKTVTTTDPAGQKSFADYQAMKRDMDAAIGAALKSRGASGYEKTQDLKQDALVRMTRLGAPAEVMKLCTQRFG